MRNVALGSGSPSSLGVRIAELPVMVWCWAAFAFFAVKSLANNAGGLAQMLGDTDDATRLVQVRELMAGAPWLDTTLARLGGTEPLLSHWSRLIDAPLAVLIWLFGLFQGPESAELTVRAIWPLLVLLPVLIVLAGTVERVAGRLPASLAMVLAATTVVALIQFQVGRIDHHNAQIMGAVCAVLLLWSLPVAPNAGLAAGLAAGFSVAVGYEGLPIVAVAAAAAVLWGLVDDKVAHGVRIFALTLAATLAVAMLITIAPSRWLDVRCDALSLNLVALTALGAGGATLALGPARSWSLVQRLQLLLAAGAAGLFAYGLLEPKCLAGPFGQVPAELKPVWLEHVAEGQSILWYFKFSAKQAIACGLFLVLGGVAHVVLYRRARALQTLFLAAAALVGSLLALWQIKYLPYASWLAIPSLAMLIASAQGTASLNVRTVRIAGVTLLNQSTILGLAGILTGLLMGADPSDKAKDDASQACFKADTLRTLDALPKGRILADIDLGPYIVALTHHSAVAAPYHRIAGAILDTHWTFAGTAQEAQTRLDKQQATYLVSCKGLENPVIKVGPQERNMASRLDRGEIPAFLEPLEVKGSGPLRVWRVQQQAAGR